MKPKKWITVLLICAAILAAAGIFSFILSLGRTVGEGKGIVRADVIGYTPPSEQPAAGGNGEVKKSATEKKGSRRVQKIYQKNKKTLVLVNRTNPLEESCDSTLTPICRGRLRASRFLCDALAQMFADAGDAGHQFWIASAWRSREKQQKLVDEDVLAGMQSGLSYEESLRQTYRETMPAGCSEHETGLALDILCSTNTNMDISQEEEPGNIWLRENCWRYGFIQRYPKDSENITGVNYEPWHFRFVGKEAAKYMSRHHLTLEEFWDILEGRDSYSKN